VGVAEEERGVGMRDGIVGGLRWGGVKGEMGVGGKGGVEGGKGLREMGRWVG